MGNVAVVGSQWGDEGKGKIVDWLSSRADVVVRFQGGHNAGHTLVVDDVVYKLSLLPAGVVRGGKLSVIGNGVVIDPWALLDEIETMAGKGVAVSPETLELARILSASKSEVFWKIRLPSSLPFLFSALKIAATTCVIGAIVGEWVGANLGLGALIIDSTFNFRSSLLYATVFLSSGLSVMLFALVTIAEKLVVRW